MPDVGCHLDKYNPYFIGIPCLTLSCRQPGPDASRSCWWLNQSEESDAITRQIKTYVIAVANHDQPLLRSDRSFTHSPRSSVMLVLLLSYFINKTLVVLPIISRCFCVHILNRKKDKGSSTARGCRVGV